MNVEINPAGDEDLASDLVWGLNSIGKVLGLNTQKVHYKLAHGQIPAKQIGNQWVASRSVLKKFMLEGMGG